MKKKVQQLPPRSRIRAEDCWDLSSLFADDQSWEKAFARWQKKHSGYERFRGRLHEGAEVLAECLKFDLAVDRLGERLGNYAFLRSAEDTSNSTYQVMCGRFMNAAARMAEASSFIRPEILSLPKKTLKAYLDDRRLARYRLLLERIVRWKPHTLSPAEERILAMQAEMAETPRQVFEQLDNADLRFGQVKNEHGEWVELSHAAFQSLLHSPKRTVRRTAFHRFYEQYEAHQHTLAAVLNGSMQRDAYYARVRGFPNALAAALFPDQVPLAVYDNLIESVHRHLPSLHRYYEVRRRKMRLREIRFYDTYVPILSRLQTRYSWDDAVGLVLAALEPLGGKYCSVLEGGLRGRWCDRYENRGKRSGAFSAGSYDGDPYILMNYRADVLDHVFTLAHEAGHSMHSYLSVKRQPYQYYQYSLVVAEVASTFNEELLSRYMMEHAKNDEQRAYLINRQIDAMRATIFRQTMFAEFEKAAHRVVDSGEPLTAERFKEIYWALLEQYFGPEFTLDRQLALECFRIPHFYRAFYVYKYATGMSAAIALAERVLGGGRREQEQYLNFLAAGCSKDPLDLLRDAGVDLETPGPVETALERFGELVEELDRLI